MLVLDHVSIAVPDLAAARPFYDAIMATLGVDKVYDRPDALGYGLRPHYHADYYGAFLYDPAGNRVEAVCHRGE